ncbi:MAG: hypothetical protein LBS10_09315 [Gracilibacteraceae bacterium]|jgi:predicted ferric reductase|nr:hypothetical protein [Gracilibacteraceae bacterium]
MKKYQILMGFLVLITVVCWLLTPTVAATSSMIRFSQLLGALSLLGLASLCFIATRSSLVDTLFEGMDKSYQIHKWLGAISVILVVAHINTIDAQSDGGPGWPSFILFLLLTLFALLSRRLNYETWKTAHKLLLLPYIIGLVHYYTDSDYAVFAPTFFSLWLNLINITGIVAAFYSVFFYEKTAFPFQFRVAEVTPVAVGTIEFTGKRKNYSGRNPKYTPGQFAFVKFPWLSPQFPSHPFTISGSFTGDMVQFTVKNLGDHTAKLVETLKPGDEFLVSQPCGRFNYQNGCCRQIWIAGGIGITPFRSFWQAGILQGFSIDLFYAYNSESEGAYLEELKAWPPDERLRIHLIDYTISGFLTAEHIKDCIDADEKADIYFCGPKPMLKSLRRQLNSGLQIGKWHNEEFQFRY